MEKVKDRLKHFLKTIPNSKGKIGISEGEFEKKVGLSNSAISNMGEGMSVKTLDKILSAYPELNKIWLLHGQGEMIINNPKKIFYLPKDDDQNIMEDDFPKEPGTNTLSDMLAISKIYAKAHENFSDAHKNFSIAHLKEQENNTELIGMIKISRSTVHDLEETQSILSAKLLVLQELLIKMGEGKKLWNSEQEGRAILHKHVTDAVVEGVSAGTHAHADKAGK